MTPEPPNLTPIEDGDILPMLGGLRVIHTPGHSAGHIALLAQRAGGLIAGDLCANMAGLDLSTVYEDRALGVASIAKAAAFDFSTAVFGHGGPLRPAANQKLRARFGASTTAVA